MIEIEKKFDQLTPEQQARLTAGAESLGVVRNVDVYFDDDRYRLTLADRWLRKRNDSWALKVPLQDRTDSNHVSDFDQYREVYDPVEIASLLLGDQWVVKEDDHQSLRLLFTLSSHGIEPFATIDATRQKFRRGRFIIDLDRTTFGYEVAEIETEAASDDPNDIATATEAVLTEARRCGLTVRPVRGKLPEYLRLHRPDHYWALVDAKVVNHYE